MLCSTIYIKHSFGFGIKYRILTEELYEEVLNDLITTMV